MHFFLKLTIDTQPRSIQSIAADYKLKADRLLHAYKEHLSDFPKFQENKKENLRNESFVFPENFGEFMAIDETSLSNGTTYTILTNRQRKGQKGTIAAIIKGTRADPIVEDIFQSVKSQERFNIKEITLDMANSMDWISRQIAPNAVKTLDRFHVEQLVFDAVQSMRIRHRWDAIEKEEEFSKNYNRVPVYKNGDTPKQLLARSRWLLFRKNEKWSQQQRERAEILFEKYPDLKTGYDLVFEFKKVYNLDNPDSAKRYLKSWCKQATDSKLTEFITLAKSIQRYIGGIANYFHYKGTNASAENFHAKLKHFIATLRGVNDKNFFFFRILQFYA